MHLLYFLFFCQFILMTQLIQRTVFGLICTLYRWKTICIWSYDSNTVLFETTHLETSAIICHNLKADKMINSALAQVDLWHSMLSSTITLLLIVTLRRKWNSVKKLYAANWLHTLKLIGCFICIMAKSYVLPLSISSWSCQNRRQKLMQPNIKKKSIFLVLHLYSRGNRHQG